MANHSTGNTELAKAGALDVDSVTKVVDSSADDIPRVLTVRASIAELRKGEAAISEAVKIGNLDWIATAERTFDSDALDSPQFLAVGVMCLSYATTWSARLKVHLKLTFPDGHTMEREAEEVANHDEVLRENMLTWEDFESGLAASDKDGELVLEATFLVVDVSGLQKSLEPIDHSAVNARFDGVLVIDGNKVHIGKQVLAFHSAHFDKLFFGEGSAEPKEEEYTLGDVSHTDFMRLLTHLRSPSAGVLNEETVEPMLRVSSKLQFQEVLKQCEALLLSSNVMLLRDKIVLADKYALTELEDSCLQEIDTAEKAREVVTWQGMSGLSDRLKFAIAMRGLFPDDSEDESEWTEWRSDEDDDDEEDEEEEEDEAEGDEDAATTA